MGDETDFSVRAALLDVLMETTAADYYPSSTMLDMIESLLRPDDVEAYAEALLARIREDEFPSISMIYRVQRLS